MSRALRRAAPAMPAHFGDVNHDRCRLRPCFLALPSINKALVQELARGEYIEQRENVIAVGNSVTGKHVLTPWSHIRSCDSLSKRKFQQRVELGASVMGVPRHRVRVRSNGSTGGYARRAVALAFRARAHTGT